MSLMVFTIYEHLLMLAWSWNLHLSFMLSWDNLVLPRCNNLFQVYPSCSVCLVSQCLLGKHSHSSFLSSVSQRALSPFILVHSDIWGPSRVKSNLGFQYFVTFIDDYSRCTWLFLIKNYSELFSIFQSFSNEIKNQFGVSIRILRSDNAREYLS